jgi:anti-sigma factor RsiW
MTMNCDLAAELLPWLLNGTLEAGERRELIAHLRGCDACRAALAETQLAWGIFDWHPSAAALVAYAGAVEAAPATTSAAPAATRDAGAGAIEEHLAGCPKCAAELELVRTSRLLADPAEDGRIAILPAPREAAGKWQGLPAPAAAAGAATTAGSAAPVASTTGSVAAAPAPSSVWARRDDAAARRAWQRSALAASVVGLLAATGWIESARHSRELERRLAVTPAPAVAPVRTGAASPSAVAARTRPPASLSTAASPASSGPGEAELRRRAGEAEVRLRALADENRQLQQQVAALGRTATELSRRSDALQASQPAPGRIESDVMVTDVEPAERAERGTGAPAAAAIPLSSGAATLLLHTRHRDSYPGYEIEVRDAQGRLVGKPTRVFRAPGGQDSFEEFDITLGRGALAPGTYTLHLFGRPAGGAAKGGREALETYSIRVS